MPFKPWLKKINPWLITAHFIAFWMFAHTFLLLVYLVNIPLANAVIYDTLHTYMKTLIDEGKGTETITYYLLLLFWAPLAGLLLAFIIALVRDILKKWFWLNSFIAFVLMYLLLKFDITGWAYLKRVFLLPGSIYESNLYFYLIVNAGVLLAIGVLLFFSKRIISLIERYNYKHVIGV